MAFADILYGSIGLIGFLHWVVSFVEASCFKKQSLNCSPEFVVDVVKYHSVTTKILSLV